MAFWLLMALYRPSAYQSRRDNWRVWRGGPVEAGKKFRLIYHCVSRRISWLWRLAVVPILFVWVYWTWCIVLLGAEITVLSGIPQTKTSS